tara:strand:+ start:125 stop:433 length:309 start_codon:yes stop_codon:yes gene_type:complete
MVVRKKMGIASAVSKSDNSKKTELLSKIDEKLSDMGEKYGPIVYEELQSRLEKTIDTFHKDVDSLFSAFPTYSSKNKEDSNSKDKDAKKPKYISDYEKSKKD